MAGTRSKLTVSLFFVFALTSLFPGSAKAAKTIYVGGAMSATGAYSQDVAAVLAAFEDYTKYVNETKLLAPWRSEKFPGDVTLEVLWRDDELKPAKILDIYEELKAKGMLVFRVSSTALALALKERLAEDHMGTTSMTSSPALLQPPTTFFTHYPIYTDSLAAVADWFLQKWKEPGKPKAAYLTADNAMGKSIELPEMNDYLKKLGYEFIGAQYVPLVPTVPPTTQLMWLKEKKVDLALGAMINPGVQPTLKEMVRLGMGPYLEYKMTLGVPSTAQVSDVAQALGELADGFVSSNSLPTWNDLETPGVRFAVDLQNRYRPGKRVTHITYELGLVEAMTQVEALRLAMREVPADKLKPVDVLNHGFYKIKSLDTGGLTSVPLTYGPGKVEGVDAVRLDQIQKGKVVKLGVWPSRHLYGK